MGFPNVLFEVLSCATALTPDRVFPSHGQCAMNTRSLQEGVAGLAVLLGNCLNKRSDIMRLLVVSVCVCL